MNVFEMINFDFDLIDAFYFCLHTYTDYFRMFSSNKKLFKFFFSFKGEYKIRKNKLIISCNPCIGIFNDIFFVVDSLERFFRRATRFFICYYAEVKKN